MDFTPKDSNENPFDVPFYDDVSSEGGWAGHTTGKSIKVLMSELSQSMTRLGANVISFQQGTFGAGTKKPREGWVLQYTIDNIAGRIKIAALPVKKPNSRNRRGYENRKEGALKMALFMMNIVISGSWYGQQLSPGYLPLVPWMIEEKSGKTLSELFTESAQLSLPANIDGEILDIDFTEVQE